MSAKGRHCRGCGSNSPTVRWRELEQSMRCDECVSQLTDKEFEAACRKVYERKNWKVTLV